jgi:hypothetical protein
MKTDKSLTIGLVIAILFDISMTISSYENKFLFMVGMSLVVINIIGLKVNLPETEDIQLKWIGFYSIPLGITAVGSIKKYHETQNSILNQWGQESIPSLIQGHSSDYEQSLSLMLFSLTIPLVVVFINIFIRIINSFIK